MVRPAWTMATVVPAIATCAERSLVASMAATVTVTVVAPPPDAGVTEIHGADGVAVHVQDSVGSIESAKVWPVTGTCSVDVGTGQVQVMGVGVTGLSLPPHADARNRAARRAFFIIEHQE